MAQAKRVALILTHGSESMEVVISADVLRRAQFHVDLISIHTDGSKQVDCSYDITLMSDYNNDPGSENAISLDGYDALVIPGGKVGYVTLANSQIAQGYVKQFNSQNKLVAAVCAGTLLIKTSGLGDSDGNKKLKITSHPSIKDQLVPDFDYQESRVVVDENILTSRGPGTTMEFALKIVEVLGGKGLADEIGAPMIVPS
ncbi:hypothetical protein H4219_004036 [Mycoemilia scoparia]|uniref:D-lactate dehydratase n=1 Tax=Mycoemilia scoparia TaxID=417184 RepID=A0A9W7ZSZ1_9FUNG|nr:hypothetical protein H4219_004036 [Mycoemilia scoparia]